MTLVGVLLYANLTSPDQAVEHPIARCDDTHDPRFQRAMSHLLGPPALVPGNRVTTSAQRRPIFPPMLERRSAAAKQTINFETYIYWSGEVARASPTRSPSAPAPA